MPVTLKPEKSIVPIVRARENNPVSAVLGTGFFIGSTDNLHIVTAKHVFEKNPLQENEKYGVAFREEKGTRILAIAKVIGHSTYDVAVFDGSGFPEAVPLCIGKEDAPLNADVFTYEYSSTRIENNPGGNIHISFEPYAHKGNIMRYYDSDFPEATKTPSIITSFPALQGASGAPVLCGTESRRHIAVVGMLVANMERHLLPAQVVRIEEGSEFTEEIRYFLPLGKGIARSVIAKCLEEMRIPFVYAEDADSVTGRGDR